MSLLTWLARRTGTQAQSHYEEKRLGTLTFPESLTEDNAFRLAITLTEVYWAIDFCADRISKLRFYIEKGDKEVTNTELNRFITKINPFFSFNDLVYQQVFSMIADGNAFGLLGVPTSLSTTPTVNNIDRFDVLRPDMVAIDEYTNIQQYRISSVADAIKKVRITGDTRDINKELLTVNSLDAVRRDHSSILSRSMLFKAIRPINNLLAVYSARYNSYVNNGMAGLLVRKTESKTGQDLVSRIGGGQPTRKDIMDDLNDRYGLTGRRNFWGVTSQPLEFINTLATIKELMPMEETLEDTVKIAAILQLPPQLIPRKDNSTFDNQRESERSVWENSLISMTDMVCSMNTRNFRLDTVGYAIKADYSNVSALGENKEQSEDMRGKTIDNLMKLIAIEDEGISSKAKKELTKILEEYGKEE
jgi:hypothetical protein